MDPGTGNRDLDPSWQVQNHQRGIESRCQAIPVEKWLDQNRKGGKSFTPFKTEIVYSKECKNFCIKS